LLACTEVNWKLIFERKKKLTGAGEMLGELCRLKPVARILGAVNGGEMDYFRGCGKTIAKTLKGGINNRANKEKR